MLEGGNFSLLQQTLVRPYNLLKPDFAGRLSASGFSGNLQTYTIRSWNIFVARLQSFDHDTRFYEAVITLGQLPSKHRVLRYVKYYALSLNQMLWVPKNSALGVHFCVLKSTL